MTQTLNHILYTNIVKPALFKVTAEKAHQHALAAGNFLSKTNLTRQITGAFFDYKNPALKKTINGISFDNPVGLAAGFDYNGDIVGILKHVGFGFNTVGTVTAKAYSGNKYPQMMRLPKSKSLLVNKGFKSQGIHVVAPKLNNPILEHVNFGVSVGSSNLPSINTITKAIDDYLETFSVLKGLIYPKYYELNISCPNAAMNEGFFSIQNYKQLLDEIIKLDLKKPIFVKMPNEASIEDTDTIVKYSMKMGINSFIFPNLVKNRENEAFDDEEIRKLKSHKGNFSGMPTRQNSRNLVSTFRKKYKNDIVLVACGGIMTSEDAKLRLNEGADLIQLITGMIYEGPDLIKRINKYLAKDLKHS